VDSLGWWQAQTFEKKTVLLFVLFFLIQAISPAMGRHNNYLAFDGGTHSVLNGQNPYPTKEEWKDVDSHHQKWFLYSPTFAIAFTPFSTYALGTHVGTYFWVMLNFFVFMAGVLRLFKLADREPAFLRGWWFFLFLLAMFNEMQSSLTNLQSNALITGLSLLGLTLYFEKRFVTAAVLLAIGTNFKLYPLAFFLLLFLDLNFLFIGTFLASVALLFLAPLTIVPADAYWGMLREWFMILGSGPIPAYCHGVETTLRLYGFSIDHLYFALFTMANAGALALVSLYLFWREGNKFIELVVPATLSFIVIFNGRSETQTFVVLAPVFGFMLLAALRHRAEGDEFGYRVGLACFLLGWIFVSGLYSDLTPKPLREFYRFWHIKTFGGIFLYLWAWFRIANYFRGRLGSRPVPTAG
jgi:hypothetical protein